MNYNKPEMTSEELIAWRQKMNMDRLQVAYLLGVTQQAVELWEKGERGINNTTARTLKLLAKFPQLLKEFR